MKRYCNNCKKEQIFDNSFDEDCLRCSECGRLLINIRIKTMTNIMDYL